MEILTVENVSFFHEKKQILSNISFSIHESEIVVLIGENGSGKSTLFEIILNDRNPSNGAVTYFGRSKFDKKKIGFSYDNFNIFSSLKIKEIINFFCIEHNLDIKHITNRYFDVFKIKPLLDSFLRQLSMGEKKRIAILLSIIYNPELLILDEPFSNIDPILCETLWKEIKRNDRAILYSTHNWNDAMNIADKIIFIKNGIVFEFPDHPSTALNVLPSKNKIVLNKKKFENNSIINKIKYYYEENNNIHVFLDNYVNDLLIKNYFDDFLYTKTTLQDVYFYTYKQKNI